MSAQQNRAMRASETLSEYLLDQGIGLFVPVFDATQSGYLFVMYPVGVENAQFGNVPDVYETVKVWLGGSIDVHDTSALRTLRIPLALILGKRKAVRS
jgi:hypothetical protein